MKTLKTLNFLLNTNICIFLGIGFLIQFLIELPFLWLSESSKINSSVEIIEQTGMKTMVFFSTVILAPFLETIIYQFAIIKIFRLLIKNLVWCFCIAIPVSAVLFALGHPYSFYYIISSFIVGLLYASFFFIGQFRKDWPAFLIIVILHGTWNLFAFIINEV